MTLIIYVYEKLCSVLDIATNSSDILQALIITTKISRFVKIKHSQRNKKLSNKNSRPTPKPTKVWPYDYR